MDTPTIPRLLTPQQAADALGISKDTLGRMVADGQIRRLKVRGSVRYSAKELSEFVQRATEAAA